MNKKNVIFLIIIALLLGIIIGTSGIFPRSSTQLPPPFTPRIPESIKGESAAFSDIVKVVSPTVVNISTTKTVKRDILPFPHFFDSPLEDFFEPFRAPRKWKEQSLGSGVIVSSDGYIITNYHVVEKADEIKVTLFDKQDYNGKIVGKDPKTDIAVIKISAKELPAIKWGDSDKLQVGELVLAFGNPFGFSHTVTMGIVSALGRANVGIADYEDFIQTDAAINPGNSGGPLVNIKGELIGINTAIFSKTGGYQGIGFATPSNMVQSVMKQLLKEGTVTRGWLGVSIQSVTPGLAKEFGLKNGRGAIVSDVLKGSPAEKAGLRRGDVIIEVNNKAINDAESLRTIIAQSIVGNYISLKVIREGKPLLLSAKIVELPEEITSSLPEEREENFTDGDTLSGFSVADLTPEIAMQLGLSRGERGVVVIRVDPYSSAEDAGLKKGDVIQEINRQRVNNLREFNNIVSHIKEGDSVLLLVNRGERRFYITFKAS